jgi:RNA polymerase sigma factor (sigma-70 family)
MQQDQRAYQLWEEYYPKVYGYFYRRVEHRTDVEDLTSLVLTNYIQKMIDPGTNITNPHGYLWRSAHNHLVNFIKSKTIRPTIVGIEGEVEDVIDTDLEYQRSQNYQTKVSEIMQCVKKQLNSIELQIVQEVVMFDKKSVEVAKAINLSAQNTRQKLSRSLKKLKQKCIDLYQLINNLFMAKLSNPFDSEENLKPLFELNACYTNSFQRDWRKNFKPNFKPNSNPLIMTIQNTITYFTKHAVVASLLLLISLGSVGAVAAELALPTEYKPSTQIKNLFAVNTQPDTDPYTRLVYDDNNNVVSIDRCDLAVKYPRQGDKKLTFNPTYSPSINDAYPSDVSLNFYPNQRPTDTNYMPNSALTIDCYSSNNVSVEQLVSTYKPSVNSSEFRDDNSKLSQKDFPITTTKLSKEDLRDKYGWFITEGDLTNITVQNLEVETVAYDYYTSVTEKKNVDLGDGKTQSIPVIIDKILEPKQTVKFHREIITLQHQGRIYQIRLTNSHPNTWEPILAGNQVQIQFESLIKSESNVIIGESDSTEQSSSSTSRSVSSNEIITNKKVELENANLDKSFSNLDCNIGEVTTYTSNLADSIGGLSINKLDLIAQEQSKMNRGGLYKMTYAKDQNPDLVTRVKNEIDNGFSQSVVTGSVSQNLFFSPQCNEEIPKSIVVQYLGPVDYPNTDKAIAFVSLPNFIGYGGSSAIGYAEYLQLSVLAIKGDELIEISSTDFNVYDYVTRAQVETCDRSSGLGLDSNNLTVNDAGYDFDKDASIKSIKCIRDKHLWNNIKLKTEANQDIQQMLSVFTLKL